MTPKELKAIEARIARMRSERDMCVASRDLLGDGDNVTLAHAERFKVNPTLRQQKKMKAAEGAIDTHMALLLPHPLRVLGDGLPDDDDWRTRMRVARDLASVHGRGHTLARVVAETLGLSRSEAAAWVRLMRMVDRGARFDFCASRVQYAHEHRRTHRGAKNA